MHTLQHSHTSVTMTSLPLSLSYDLFLFLNSLSLATPPPLTFHYTSPLLLKISVMLCLEYYDCGLASFTVHNLIFFYFTCKTFNFFRKVMLEVLKPIGPQEIITYTLSSSIVHLYSVQFTGLIEYSVFNCCKLPISRRIMVTQTRRITESINNLPNGLKLT